MLAIILSLIGFFLQFIDLRGLNWSVTIAQLGSVIIMTVFRAIIRRNMAYDIPSQQIESHHELDAAARRIRGCSHWNIVTVANSSSDLGQTTARNSTGLAHRVFNARCQLENLCPWEFQWQATVDLMADAMEGTMNFIYTSPDVNKKGSLGTEFPWKLSIQVKSERSEELQRFALGAVELKLSREYLYEGRGWGPWKADKSQIRAALGLWMLHFKLESKAKLKEGMSISRDIDRVVCMGESPAENYKKWIRRQEKYRVVGHGQQFAEDTSTYRALVGYPFDPNDSHQDLVVVRTDSPLERVCGQIIFSEFMSCVVSQVVESIGGQVLTRGGDQWLKASIGLRNTISDELAIKLEETGLATVDEAYLCIIPSLTTNDKLCDQADGAQELFNKGKEIRALFEGGRLQEAEFLLWWLLDDTDCAAKGLETTAKWPEACEVYARLWGAYDGIEGANDFAEMAVQAMGQFCKRLFQYYKNHDKCGEPFRATIDLLQTIFSDSGMEDKQGEERWNKCRDILTEWVDSDMPEGTGGEILERMSQANACTPDAGGMTALHHAAKRNLVSVVGFLLRGDASNRMINTVDKNGKTPLDLAIEHNAGAVVALLTFHGADDKHGKAKRLRETAMRNGSFQAVQAVQAGISENDEYGRTALHWAVWRGSLQTVKFLKGKVKDIDARDKDQLAALHIAAMGGNDAIVRLLVSDFGADKQAKTGNGSMALHLAAANGSDSTVRLLVSDLGADIDPKSGDGSTALHLAAANGNHLTVRLLSDLGADKEAKTGNGSMALHLAAANGSNSTVRLLVSDLGADIDAKSGDGSTALHLAAKFGHFSTVGELLGILRANKKQKDDAGNTPLLVAVIWWWVSTTSELVQDLAVSNCSLVREIACEILIRITRGV